MNLLTLQFILDLLPLDVSGLRGCPASSASQMKHNKEVKISYWAAHLTTIVSVALVLLIIGIIALICVSATHESDLLRERIELSAIMTDSVSDAGASGFAERLKAKPFVASVEVVTAKQALDNWTADTGEDLEQLFGVNPLSPEVTFTLKPQYANPSSIEKIKTQLRRSPEVEDVAAPDAVMVENMNANIETFAMILGAIALVMVVISFVLINNTVHLSIYSRRFTIHTMQLVGATDAFIRRPFINANMLSGLIAGLAASGIIALALAAAPKAGFDDVATYISWTDFGIIAASLVAGGALLCGLAACIATSRYLHKDYDELFK